jgi:hypothetical protein
MVKVSGSPELSETCGAVVSGDEEEESGIGPS